MLNSRKQILHFNAINPIFLPKCRHNIQIDIRFEIYNIKNNDKMKFIFH